MCIDGIERTRIGRPVLEFASSPPGLRVPAVGRRGPGRSNNATNDALEPNVGSASAERPVLLPQRRISGCPNGAEDISAAD